MQAWLEKGTSTSKWYADMQVVCKHGKRRAPARPSGMRTCEWYASMVGEGHQHVQVVCGHASGMQAWLEKGTSTSKWYADMRVVCKHGKRRAPARPSGKRPPHLLARSSSRKHNLWTLCCATRPSSKGGCAAALPLCLTPGLAFGHTLVNCVLVGHGLVPPVMQSCYRLSRSPLPPRSDCDTANPVSVDLMPSRFAALPVSGDLTISRYRLRQQGT
eukprot:1160024-Pelagomonas_calceolata.AAC.6